MSRAIRLTHRQIDALWCLGYSAMTIEETADLMMISPYTARDYAHQLRSIFGVEKTRHLGPCAHRWFRYGRLSA